MLENLSNPLGGITAGRLTRTENRRRSSQTMLAFTLFLALAPAVPPAFSQTPPTTINLATQGRNPDFSTLPFTRPVTVGASLPATCQVGQLFFSTASAAGSNLYGCTAANVWTLEGAAGSAPSGGGGGAPAVSVAPSSITFSAQHVGATSSVQPVVLSNNGTAALSINGITLSGSNAADFSQSNNCGSSLAANGTCTITVSFTPSAASSETATVLITDNGSGSPHSITLSGTGTNSSSSSGPVLTPSVASAKVATPLTVTSDRAVTWSLAAGSVGSISSQSGTSLVYTPPSTITPQNSIAGCMILPNDSVFNTRIDNLPLATNSATWTSYMGTNPVTIGVSWGINVVDNSLAATPQVFHYTTQGNGNFQIAQWPNRKRETGALTTDSSNDHHMITVNRQTCHFYETYQDSIPVSGCPACTAASGWQYDGTSYAQPSSSDGGGTTDAAGLPLAPLTLHLSEIQAGVVNHAFRFTLCTGCININTFLWPATLPNGSNLPAAPPMGARFRLKKSYSVNGVYKIQMGYGGSGYTTAPTVTVSGCQTAPAATATLSGGSVQSVTLSAMGASCSNPAVSFNGGSGSGATATALTFSPQAQVILTALQQYGMFLADNGLSGSIQADTDITQDPQAWAAVEQVGAAQIGSSNFEVVDESSLMLSAASSQVNPANGYVTPVGYALVKAVDGQGNQSSLPIPIQPVLVGVPYTDLTIQAGMPGYQLPSWVNGSNNQSATWTLQSGPGTVTAAGLYTPPSTASSAAKAVLIATAAADSNAKATVFMNVIPVGGNPTGSIRIDVANANSYTDAQGNLWLPDMAYETAAFSLQNDNYPTNAWGSLTDAPLYQTYKYTWGDDIFYGPFIVPNGNYKVGFSMTQGGCAGTYSPGPFDNGLIWGTMGFEAQGQIGARFDPGKVTNFACRTPATVYIPAQVTNNVLYLAMRALTVPGGHSAPFLNALTVVPDSSAAHIAIDTQQVTAVAHGTTAQMYAVGWYVSNAVTWSVSGGGSIDQTGLYTAPSTAPSGQQSVTITATSTANPNLSATATLTIN